MRGLYLVVMLACSAGSPTAGEDAGVCEPVVVRTLDSHQLVSSLAAKDWTLLAAPGLSVVDLDDPYRGLAFRGVRYRDQLGLKGTISGFGRVIVAGDAAFIAGGGQLAVFDPDAEPEPRLLGHAAITGAVSVLDVSGTIACVAAEPGRLELVDISDPSRPVRRGGFELLSDARAGAINGDFGVVLTGDRGLLTFAAADLDRPRALAELALPDNPVAVEVVGGVAYCAYQWEGLRVVSVADPRRPEELVALDVNAWSLLRLGDRLLVGTERGVEMFDISVPSVPTRVGSVDIKITTPDSRAPLPIMAMTAWGDRVVAAALSGGLVVLDMSSCMGGGEPEAASD